MGMMQEFITFVLNRDATKRGSEYVSFPVSFVTRRDRTQQLAQSSNLIGQDPRPSFSQDCRWFYG